MTASDVDFAITCWETARRVIVSREVRRTLIEDQSFSTEKECWTALESRQRTEPTQFVTSTGTR